MSIIQSRNKRSLPRLHQVRVAEPIRQSIDIIIQEISIFISLCRYILICLTNIKYS